MNKRRGDEISWRDAIDEVMNNGFTVLNRIPFRDRLLIARQHAIRNNQMNDALWPYQEFSVTIGELIESAIKQEIK